jgi:hypothetical protein
MIAFARFCTLRGIERIKRYQFGWRYSESPAGGQPRAVSESNLDLISPSRTMVSEAEAIEGELNNFQTTKVHTEDMDHLTQS